MRRHSLTYLCLCLVFVCGVSHPKLSAQSATDLLHWAVKEGEAPDLREALFQGANINAKDSEGMTPLMLATLNREHGEEIIRELLSDPLIDIHVKAPSGETALMLASAYVSDYEIISEILAEGVDVNEQDDFGYTPLMYAAGQNKEADIVRELLEEPTIDVNLRSFSDPREDPGLTALMFAAWKNRNPEIIEALLDETEIDVNIQDDDGWTALMWAAYYSQSEGVVSALLSSPDTDIDLTNRLDQTALDLARVAPHKESKMEIISLLERASSY